MTMAKSLVTVTVDTAFRNFPIDSERYELTERVEDYAFALANGEQAWFPAPVGGNDNVFLFETHGSFRRAAQSYADVTTSTCPSELALAVQDRARRAINSLPDRHPLHWAHITMARSEVERLMYNALWMELYVRLCTHKLSAELEEDETLEDSEVPSDMEQQS